MKGSNTLKVSQDTLVEIVQFYIDRKLPELGQVERVKECDRMTHAFEVDLKEREVPLALPPAGPPPPPYVVQQPPPEGYEDDGLGPAPSHEPPPAVVQEDPPRMLTVVKRKLKE